MIVKMEISILYHVIVNSQLTRDNLTRCYIMYITRHNAHTLTYQIVSYMSKYFDTKIKQL